MEQPDWEIADTFIQYDEAVEKMEERVAEIRAGNAPELVWLLEHPPLYTAGTSAKATDLLDPQFPVFESGRGGQYTYHGPGQRVAYVMLDLKKRQQAPDIKQYVCNLEQWIINSLQEFDIEGKRVDGRVGIWVSGSGHRLDTPRSGGVADDGPKNLKKIAAIGVRVRHWVTYHGIAINVNPDLSHFNGIVPCGISDAGVTSFADLKKPIDMKELDAVLQKEFDPVFQSAASGKACA
jgi:lipoyl(octanoyl) transferase